MSSPDSVSADRVASADSAASLAGIAAVAVPISVPPWLAVSVSVSSASVSASSVADRVAVVADAPAPRVSVYGAVSTSPSADSA